MANGHGGPRANSGGARPGAGAKKKPPLLVEGLDGTTYKTFLHAVMNNEKIDIKERINAAKTLANLDKKPGTNPPMGKKEQLKGAALRTASGDPDEDGGDDKDDADTFQTGAAPNVTPMRKRG